MLHPVENAGPSAAPMARAPSAPPPSGTGAPRAAPREDGAGEAEAWAHVLAGWEDEGRHRAYLAGCADLDALAVAGRRYREALAARPGDAVAARRRDEVIRRALSLGLAALPRTAPVGGRGRLALRAASIAVLAALGAGVALALRAVGPHLGAAP